MFSLIKSRTDSRGFTMVELLVVIVIIGILATVALGSNYLTSQRRARDAKKIATIHELAIAMEAYYLDRHCDGVPCYPDNSMPGNDYYSRPPADVNNMGPAECYCLYATMEIEENENDGCAGSVGDGFYSVDCP